jgi:2-oxoglutarate ferredoxin oxidoreductase subunit gamma
MKKKDDIKTTEIRLSGSGGQGLITAGYLLAKAAVLDGINVTQTKSYGPESRGGASRTDVILSNATIYFPEATNFDILLCLTQEALDKYIDHVKNTGILVADSKLVKNIPKIEAKIYSLPFTEKTVQTLGTTLPTNIVALSFLVRKTHLVSEKSLKDVIKQFKPRFAEMNIKAMKLGFALADNFKD